MRQHHAMDDASLLHRHGLKDTHARRAVMRALRELRKPSGSSDVCKRLEKAGERVNAVTVYRVLAVLEATGLAHRHPCNGGFSLCAMPDEPGHHGFLHCTACGKTQEFCDADLCRAEQRVARSRKFSPRSHVSEMVGLCSSCISSFPR